MVQAPSSPSLLRLTWLRFRRDRLALVGLILLVGLLALAVCATPISELVTRYQPEQIELLGNLKPPGWRRSPEYPVHWLGTDELGRDVLTRVIFGARVSLVIAILTVTLTVTLGTFAGAVAGYFGGIADTLTSTAINVLLSVPILFLLVLVNAVFRPPWWGLAFALAAVSWMVVARLVRGEFLSVREREYVLAAHALGIPTVWIIVRHILPNATSPIIVAATLQVGTVILTETALSYLGFGVQPPTPSWGNMLSNAQQYIFIAPSLIVIPGIFIFVTVLSFNFVGNGLRDALDPQKV